MTEDEFKSPRRSTGLLSRTGVAVEKLALHEFAEIASRQEALRTIFSSLLDIFYRPIFDFFQKNRVFQQPQGLSPSISRDVGRGFLNIYPKREHCREKAHLISALIDRTLTGKCVPRPLIELRASLD